MAEKPPEQPSKLTSPSAPSWRYDAKNGKPMDEEASELPGLNYRIRFGRRNSPPRWLIVPAPSMEFHEEAISPDEKGLEERRVDSMMPVSSGAEVLCWSFDPPPHEQDNQALYRYAYDALREALGNPRFREEARDYIRQRFPNPVVEEKEDPLPRLPMPPNPRPPLKRQEAIPETGSPQYNWYNRPMLISKPGSAASARNYLPGETPPSAPEDAVTSSINRGRRAEYIVHRANSSKQVHAELVQQSQPLTARTAVSVSEEIVRREPLEAPARQIASANLVRQPAAPPNPIRQTTPKDAEATGPAPEQPSDDDEEYEDKYGTDMDEEDQSKENEFSSSQAANSNPSPEVKEEMSSHTPQHPPGYEPGEAELEGLHRGPTSPTMPLEPGEEGGAVRGIGPSREKPKEGEEPRPTARKSAHFTLLPPRKIPRAPAQSGPQTSSKYKDEELEQAISYLAENAERFFPNRIQRRMRMWSGCVVEDRSKIGINGQIDQLPRFPGKLVAPEAAAATQKKKKRGRAPKAAKAASTAPDAAASDPAQDPAEAPAPAPKKARKRNKKVDDEVDTVNYGSFPKTAKKPRRSKRISAKD